MRNLTATICLNIAVLLGSAGIILNGELIRKSKPSRKMNLVVQCITKKYAEFSSRASRKEFWLFVVCYIVVYLIFTRIDVFAGTYNLEIGLGVFSGIFLLLTVIPYWAVIVRRLHDTNRVGWWALLFLIPLVGSIWVIVLLCLKGNEDENRFG